RERKDQERLWEGLHDGTLDLIATDHAPHLTEEKASKSWSAAPGGMIGLETMLPQLLTAVGEGRLTLPQLVEWTSTRPATIFGLAGRKGDIRPGLDADFVLVDLDAEWTLQPEHLHSKSKNSPLLGARLRGKVVHTIVRGHVVVENGKLGEPIGQWLPGACWTAGTGQPARIGGRGGWLCLRRPPTSPGTWSPAPWRRPTWTLPGTAGWWCMRRPWPPRAGQGSL